MKIPLPDDYNYKQKAIVQNNILCMNEYTSFKALMYDLTLHVKNPDICYYCHRPIHKGSSQTQRGESPDFRTMDHLYPRNLGGPTIPNNLVPSCSICNGRKDNMTETDFNTYRRLDESKKKQFKDDLKIKYDFICKWYIPLVPEGWVKYISPEQIEVIYPFSPKRRPSNYAQQKEYNRVSLMYYKYGRIYLPIVVDKNYKLLDGIGSLAFALDHNIDKVPVIVLENVEAKFEKDFVET